MSKVLLEGGPADGIEVEASGWSPLIIEGHGVPDGMVARYRRKRQRDAQGRIVFSFREWDRVVLRVPV